jgi:hypothetical protein
MYIIEKPDGLPHAGISSELYDAVTMDLVPIGLSRLWLRAGDPSTDVFRRSHSWIILTSLIYFFTNSPRGVGLAGPKGG